MNPFKEYTISFTGLKAGLSHYDYLIEHSFFRLFEHSAIKEARIWVNLDLTKESRMLILDFNTKGTVCVPCDLCTEYFHLPIQGKNRLIIQFGNESYENTDEIIVLTKDTSEVNIAQYIYEYIHLLVPHKIIHSMGTSGDNKCDKKTLGVLNKLRHASKSSENPDPRWEALRKLSKT